MRSDCGCITDMGDGRWRVRVSAGHDPVTGKRIRLSRTIRGTKRDALRVRTELLVLAGDTEHVRSDMTFGEFFEDVFLVQKEKQVRNGEMRPNSFERIRNNVRRNTGSIWNMRLAKVTPYHVASLLGDIPHASARHSTYSDLKTVWNCAVKWGFLGKAQNVILYVDAPRKPKPEIKTADPELLLRILTAFRGHGLEPILLVMSGCGLRLSEACALDWDVHFDWEAGVIDVSRSYHKLQSGETYLSDTKTEGSKGVVSVPASFFARLAEIAGVVDGVPSKTGPISVIRAGKNAGDRMNPASAGKTYRKFYRNNLGDEEYVVLKNLRHTHATILVENDVDILHASKRLRHADIQITAQRYAKPGSKSDMVTASAFDKIMKEAGPNESQTDGVQAETTRNEP